MIAFLHLFLHCDSIKNNRYFIAISKISNSLILNFS